MAARVVIKPRVEGTAIAAGVGQEEGARAVGALGLARLHAALADQRGLLVAGHARDRQAVGEVVEARGHAEIARAGADLAAIFRAEPRRTHRGRRPNRPVSRSISRVREALVTSVTMLAGRRSGARSTGYRRSPRPARPPSARGRAPGT